MNQNWLNLSYLYYSVRTSYWYDISCQAKLETSSNQAGQELEQGLKQALTKLEGSLKQKWTKIGQFWAIDYRVFQVSVEISLNDSWTSLNNAWLELEPSFRTSSNQAWSKLEKCLTEAWFVLSIQPKKLEKGLLTYDYPLIYLVLYLLKKLLLFNVIG